MPVFGRKLVGHTLFIVLLLDTQFTASYEYAEAALAVLKYDVRCTVIRFVCFSAKFGTCTVVSVDVIFNKCPIYTHDGASAKLSINSLETNYSVAFCMNFARCYV